MMYMGFVGGCPSTFLVMRYWHPYQLRLLTRKEVKHPNFGGFSQGIDIILGAVAFMDLLDGFVEFCA